GVIFQRMTVSQADLLQGARNRAFCRAQGEVAFGPANLLLPSAPYSGRVEAGPLAMLHKAGDLSYEQKMALESLLGRAISDRETVSVRAFESPPLSDEQQQEVLDGLDAYFARIDAQRPPLSDEEAEAILDE